MYLTRHATPHGPRWAVDGMFLAEGMGLDMLLSLPVQAMSSMLLGGRSAQAAAGELLPPVEHGQEVWAAGVTYLRSREARMSESDTADLYEKVYDVLLSEKSSPEKPNWGAKTSCFIASWSSKVSSPFS